MVKILFVFLLLPVLNGFYWNWVIKQKKAFIIGLILMLVDIVYNIIIVNIKIKSNLPYVSLTKDNISIYERILYIIYNVMFWISMITILVKLCRDSSKRIKLIQTVR